jgi:hypothetical protein
MLGQLPLPLDPQEKRQDRHPHPHRRPGRRLRPWFDSHRRLRELIAELEALSLDIAESDPRWNR